MFLAEPPRTQYDVNFQVFGFPVRVTPFFWIVVAAFGWNLANYADHVFQNSPALTASNPGHGMLLILWVAAVFVSILVHELGHAIAMRRYGSEAYIVLYHFGGLAVPDSGSSFVRRGRMPNNSREQIVISAAGPGAQLVLAAIVAGAMLLTQSAFPQALGVPLLELLVPLHDGEVIASAPLAAVMFFVLWPSFFWALLNLLPVYPLDGGQIAREVLMIWSPRDGLRASLMLSVAAGAGVAVYGLLIAEQPFLAIMFAMLAYSSYQILQQYSGRGGGFGPW